MEIKETDLSNEKNGQELLDYLKKNKIDRKTIGMEYGSEWENNYHLIDGNQSDEELNKLKEYTDNFKNAEWEDDTEHWKIYHIPFSEDDYLVLFRKDENPNPVKRKVIVVTKDIDKVVYDIPKDENLPF